MVIVSVMEVRATVVSVDRRDRSIVVKDLEGQVRKIELTDDVQNFDQIRTGDQVVVEVYAALAM